MPINIARSQRSALDEGFLDTLGTGRSEEGISISSTEDVLIKWAGDFILAAQQNLDGSDAVSSGELSKSIKFTINVAATKYRLDISMADYYDFVNKGVRGHPSNSGANAIAPNSPYQFKKLTVGPDFLKSLTEWVRREGLKSKIIPEAKVTEKIYKRRAKVLGPQNRERSLAYLIGRSIKYKGLRPTGFFDKAYDKLYPRLAEDLAKALGEDVANAFRRLQTRL